MIPLLGISLLDLGLPFARLLDAEDAHRLAITALKTLPLLPPADDPRLKVEAFGLIFPNPVGLAAGFDKDAEVPDAALKIGFGFAEVGTLTPKAQTGNPRPRVFRLVADEAAINRLGFNNGGFAAAHNRLAARGRGVGILGVNVGANRESADRVADYVEGVETFAVAADYFTVNVSSPNTPGLRDLQLGTALDDLVVRVIEAREQAAARAAKKPVLLKIAPDLSLNELDGVVALACKRGIDGIVVANTTIARPRALCDPSAREAGGLSGRPLFSLSTRMLAETYLRVEGAFPLVGVGGIDSADAAWQKIRAGAALVQLYTALIYKGFSLVAAIKRGLVQRLERERIKKITDVVGVDVNAIVRAPWPV